MILDGYICLSQIEFKAVSERQAELGVLVYDWGSLLPLSPKRNESSAYLCIT